MMIKRNLALAMTKTLRSGKSVLLIGPRQTGKTTLIRSLKADVYINLLDPENYQFYLSNPLVLKQEVYAIKKTKPLIVLDEVQRVPHLLDTVQTLIDDQVAQFIITGSSVKKLNNLLPGRVIRYVMDPLCLTEISDSLPTLLLDGSLPGIYTLPSQAEKEHALSSYFTIYLEEEIRREAFVRQLGAFAKFWELVCQESGNIVSFRALSGDIGVSHTTVTSYFQLLEETLIIERFDPITKSQSRTKLTKSSKYILFDLGLRRIGAREGHQLSPERMGHLFEQFVGLELRRLTRHYPLTKIRFWRDPNGPEVDWVIDTGQSYIPIEVKWTPTPTEKHIRHLRTFISEYPNTPAAFVVCQTPRPRQLSDNITAIPWTTLPSLITQVH